LQITDTANRIKTESFTYIYHAPPTISITSVLASNGSAVLNYNGNLQNGAVVYDNNPTISGIVSDPVMPGQNMLVNISITEGDGTTQNVAPFYLLLNSGGSSTFSVPITISRGKTINGLNNVNINVSDGVSENLVYPLFYKTKWTAIMYFDGDQTGISDLSPELQNNITDIQNAGGNSSQIDFYILFGKGSSNGPDELMKVTKISGSSNYEDLHSMLSQINPIWTGPNSVNMADKMSLEKFAQYVIQYCPSDHYWLDISNHGNGWDGGCQVNSFSSPNWMTLGDIKDALDVIKQTNAKPIDVLSFDACLMSMAEVACAVQPDCNFLVGSEELVPGDGYQYKPVILNLINDINNGSFNNVDNNGDINSTKNFAIDIVTQYGNFYSDGHEGFATLSALDMTSSRLAQNALRADVSHFADAIFAQAVPNAFKFYRQINLIRQTPQGVQRFGYDPANPCFNDMWSADIVDLGNSLTAINDSQINSAVQQLVTDRNSIVINETHTNTYDHLGDPDPRYFNKVISDNNAHGLAIYFIINQADYYDNTKMNFDSQSNYDSLDFSLGNSWPNFIKRNITGPEFVTTTPVSLHVVVDNAVLSTAPISINNLGDSVQLGYSLNEDSQVRYTILDKNGNVCSTSSLYARVPGNTNISFPFDGTIVNTNGETHLLSNENSPYYIKLEMIENIDFDGAMYVDPNTQQPYYLSGPISVAIPCKQVPVTITTPQNKRGYTINVPGCNAAAILNNYNGHTLTVDSLVLVNGVGNLKLPLNETYNINVTKQGYQTYTGILNVNNDINSSQSFLTPSDISTTYNSANCFRPYMPWTPNETCDQNVKSDGAGIPDGWNYYYWSQPDWTPAYGCNLSVNDVNSDGDISSSNQTLSSAGDGFTNLDEYILQQQPLNIPMDPRYIDLVVELDWVNDNKPSSIVTDTCTKIFADAGVRVHFTTGHNIHGPSNTQASVDLTDLYTLLNSSMQDFKGVNTAKIVHAIFAPGWTNITQNNGATLPDGIQNGLGGLYVNLTYAGKQEQGIFVFDLKLKTLSNWSGDPHIEEDDKLLDKYNGYILAHELGHVAGYSEATDASRQNDDIMYQYIPTDQPSDHGYLTLGGSDQRKFYPDEISQFKFNPIYSLAGDFQQLISFKPQIFFASLPVYQQAGPYTINSQVVDFGDLPSHVTCKIVYKTSTDNGNTWSAFTKIDMTRTNSSSIMYSAFNYTGQIPAQSVNGTIVKYYLEAADSNNNLVTKPELGTNLIEPPPTLFQFTVVTTPPNLQLSVSPNYLSPNGDGINDSVSIYCASQAGTPFLQNFILTVQDANHNIIYAPAPVTQSIGIGSMSFIWNGTNDNGNQAPEGNYTVMVTANDQAGNSVTASQPLVIEFASPVILSQSIQVIPGVVSGIFTAKDNNINVNFNIKDYFSTSANLTVTFNSGSNSVVKTQTVNITPGHDTPVTIAWNGTNASGRGVHDGTYTMNIVATNLAGNSTTLSNIGSVVIDKTVPAITVFNIDNPIFYPDVSGATPSNVTLNYTISKACTTTISILNNFGQTIFNSVNSSSVLQGNFLWDGKVNGIFVQDGVYTLRLNVADQYGNVAVQNISVIKDGIVAQITSPLAGSGISGKVAINGVAIDPNLNSSTFGSYKLWYRQGNITDFTTTDNNPLNPSPAEWMPIPVPASNQNASDPAFPQSNISTRPIMNGMLGVWDVSSLAPGVYTIMLVSMDQNLQYSFAEASVTVGSSTVSTPMVTIISPASQTPPFPAALNVLSDAINVAYTLNLSGLPNANIGMDIFQMNGAIYGPVVYHRDYLQETGNGNINWNGMNSLATSYVANGIYRVRLTAYGSNGQVGTPAEVDINLTNNIGAPLKVTQLQVQPNPVIPGSNAVVNFQPSLNSQATVEIDDTNGTLIQTLMNNTNVTGGNTQTLTWASTTAGLYVCKVTLLNSVNQSASASQDIEVANSTGTGTAIIASPNGTGAVQGQTLLNWRANASGTYYQPQQFTVPITVNGSTLSYPNGNSQNFTWAVSAGGTETYHENLVQPGSANQSGNNRVDQYVKYFYINNVFYVGQYENRVNFSVTYPQAFQGVPTLTLTGNIIGVTIDTQSAAGFTAHGFVYNNVYHCDGSGNAYGSKVYDWYPKAPSDASISWSATRNETYTAPAKATVTGSLSMAPGTSSNQLFSITVAPQHTGGILSNVQFIQALPDVYFQGSNDFDNSNYIDSSVNLANLSFSVVGANSVIQGIVQFNDNASVINSPWSQVFTMDSSSAAQWSDVYDICYKFHPIHSQTLSSFYTLPPNFGGFTTPKYTVGTVNNTNVSVLINGENLVASSTFSTPWTTNMDQNLAANGGFISVPAQVFNNSNNPTYFITENLPLTYASAYPGGNMTTPSVYDQYCFWLWAATNTENPYIGVDASTGGWNVNLNYADNSSLGSSLNTDFQTDMRVSDAANMNRDASTNIPLDYDDKFGIKMNNGSAPQMFIPILGSTSGASQGFRNYALFYQQAGSTVWNSIPSATGNSVTAGGVLGYWNVNNLNGAYTLKLAVSDGSGVTESLSNVTVGTTVSASAGGTVLGPCNKSYLQIPANSLAGDAVISISAQKPQQSGLTFDPNVPPPIGAVYNLLPNGQLFSQNKPAILSIRLLPGEVAGYDLSAFQVYSVEADGTLQAISVGTQVSEQSSDTTPVTITRLDFPITHFSHYVVMPGINFPVLYAPASITNNACISISGTAEPDSSVQIFVNGVAEGTTITSSSGQLSASVFLTQGSNTITAVANRSFAKGSISSKPSNGVQIVLAAAAPQIQGISVSPSPYCTDNGPAFISWHMSVPALVTCRIFDSAGNLTRTVLSSISMPAGITSTAWDGTNSYGLIVPNGKYTVHISAIDAAGNVGQAISANPFWVGCRNEVPSTVLSIGSPQYINGVGNLFVSAATPLSLTATDSFGNTVVSVSYRLQGGNWITIPGLQCNISLGNVGGNYEIDYYSQDDKGNKERMHKAFVYLDSAVPMTQINIKNPQYINPVAQNYTFVTGNTAFNIAAADPGQNGFDSGVLATYYQIGNGGWITGTSFNLSGVGEGNQVISYYSADNLGQRENAHSITVTVDNSVPVIGLRMSCGGCNLQGLLSIPSGGQIYLDNPDYTVEPIVQDKNFDPVLGIALIPSGIGSIDFQVDDGTWTPYSWTVLKTALAIPSNHSLNIQAVDNLGNSSTFFAEVLRIPSPTVSPTITETNTATMTPTVTQTNTDTVTSTVTGTVTCSVTPSITGTATGTNTETITETCTGTVTPSMTNTATPTTTQTNTDTITATVTGTTTSSITPTNTETATETVTDTITTTVTNTTTPTNTVTPSITLTSTNTSTGTITKTITATSTTTLTSTPTATVTISVQLRAQYYSYNTNSQSDTIYVNIRIYNDGANTAYMGSIKARYWYTYEGIDPEVNEVDTSFKMPSGQHIETNTVASLYNISYCGQTRVQVTSFNSNAGSIQPGEYVEFHVRVNHTQYSQSNMYNQLNDYSFGTQNAFIDCNKITLYYD
jgi:flagellar hook assembly protein FlgD